jgi:4-hydroxybenzoate polyprenyltransferase
MTAYTDIPSRSFLRFLPAWTHPYAQLARWDRPVGTWLLFWPCAWSVSLAAQMQEHQFDLVPLAMIAAFWLGAFFMRGAGCTLNDMADVAFDAAVERTAGRPLPSGRVTRKQAAVFMVLQALGGLVVVLQFNLPTIALSFAALVIVALYPFAKRVTNWPQLVLGLAFNWGALVGWSAWYGQIALPAVLLYLAGIAWTLGYDTIYAHQDKSDDAIVGVKSTALLFGDKTLVWVSGFYALTWVLLVAAGLSAGAGAVFLLLMLAAGGHLIWQVRASNIDDQAQCLKIFKSNVQFGGLVWIAIMFASLA